MKSYSILIIFEIRWFFQFLLIAKLVDDIFNAMIFISTLVEVLLNFLVHKNYNF
jgi:hypothetical protein